MCTVKGGDGQTLVSDVRDLATGADFASSAYPLLCLENSKHEPFLLKQEKLQIPSKIHIFPLRTQRRDSGHLCRFGVGPALRQGHPTQ